MRGRHGTRKERRLCQNLPTCAPVPGCCARTPQRKKIISGMIFCGPTPSSFSGKGRWGPILWISTATRQSWPLNWTVPSTTRETVRNMMRLGPHIWSSRNTCTSCAFPIWKWNKILKGSALPSISSCGKRSPHPTGLRPATFPQGKAMIGVP